LVAAILSASRRHRGATRRLGVALLCIALGTGIAAVALDAPGRARGASDEVRVLLGTPATLDPAAAGDSGSSAVIGQLFETLTAMDPGLNVRPALAASWEILDGGRRVVFHLRPDLVFSDGSPLHAADVVRSWLRIIDPDRPSPLASLMLDVTGARDYVAGRTTDPSSVGLRADGDTVEVDLVRPAADFVSIVACTTFAVVPERIDPYPLSTARTPFVGSGGYVLESVGADRLTLVANERYWAGRPAIGTVHLVNDLGGRSIVAAYEDGDLDYSPISGLDAPWIRYDETLGPDLREETTPSVTYLAFDTLRPPFDDVRVRRAFGAAVDWRRIVALSDPDAVVATGLVPPGIPGRSEGDYLPVHDPDAARDLLADAGFPGGRGFPDVAIMSSGFDLAGAVIEDLRRELGIEIRHETVDFEVLTERLVDDPPAIWTLGWIADYPGANDFLGVLLRTGEANNHGGWSSPEFDAALDRALSAATPAEAQAGFDDAQAVLQRDVPLVPLQYDAGWALARPGLLGANLDGLGNLRLAGLAWQDGS
jgi:oligopeptide transport system substrate-binding protein